MIITAADLIQKNISTISYQDTVATALIAMEDMDLHQIVVVHEEKAEGILYQEDIAHLDQETPIEHALIRDHNIGIHGAQHALEAIKLLSSNDWEVVPILHADMSYAGCVKWDYALATISNLLSVNLPGSILVLRRLALDYSMAEIARICESNDCRIIGAGIMPEEGSHALIVTIKIDKQEVGPLVASFYRYDYEVVASFGDDRYKDYLNDRYDLLMHYLNM